MQTRQMNLNNLKPFPIKNEWTFGVLVQALASVIAFYTTSLGFA